VTRPATNPGAAAGGADVVDVGGAGVVVDAGGDVDVEVEGGAGGFVVVVPVPPLTVVVDRRVDVASWCERVPAVDESPKAIVAAIPAATATAATAAIMSVRGEGRRLDTPLAAGSSTTSLVSRDLARF
jgi:hypothetical protein